MLRRTAILGTFAVLGLTPLVGHAQDNLRELRDEGLRNIGWVAGNAYGHPVWQDIKRYVGKGGSYYDLFTRLAPQGSNAEAEAYQNVSLYRNWFEKGQDQPFNEKEAVLRIQRVHQIVEELKSTRK